jgi:outer membrane protein insertion porin family
LEKQANNLQNKFFIKLFSASLVLSALFFTFNASAQIKNDSINVIKNDTLNITKKDTIINNQKVEYEIGKEYILGGITVTGLKKFSEETVKVFTGLVNGQLLRLPGDKLTSAIKKLYESKQFSNVDVYLVKVDEQAIYLEFDVQELPQLNEVRINGVKKSKAKELIKEAELKLGAMVTDNLLVTTKNYFTKKYTDKGYLKTKVTLDLQKDTSDMNVVNMNVYIDQGQRIKIKKIKFFFCLILNISKIFFKSFIKLK